MPFPCMCPLRSSGQAGMDPTNTEEALIWCDVTNQSAGEIIKV